MTLKEAVKKYPDTFIVLMPLKRDIETGKPLSIKVLTACYSADEALAAERQYPDDGFEVVCVLPNYDHEVVFPPEKVAKMFRVLYGMAEMPRMDILTVPYHWLGGDDNGDLC